MQVTKIFRNDNSQTELISAESTRASTESDVTSDRVGEKLRTRPIRRSLAGVLTKFTKFGPDFMTEERGENEQAERDFASYSSVRTENWLRG